MDATGSKLEKALGDHFPEGEHYFGLENFSNTCYCNSVLHGNAASKKKEWNKAVNYYTEAIKLNEGNATFYSNRAAAYLELGCFQEAEEDCSKAISLDKKNVKAYMTRGTARESLLFLKEALKDFKHVCVLEPQNKTASDAEKRLRKMMT